MTGFAVAIPAIIFISTFLLSCTFGMDFVVKTEWGTDGLNENSLAKADGTTNDLEMGKQLMPKQSQLGFNLNEPSGIGSNYAKKMKRSDSLNIKFSSYKKANDNLSAKDKGLEEDWSLEKTNLQLISWNEILENFGQDRMEKNMVKDQQNFTLELERFTDFMEEKKVKTLKSIAEIGSILAEAASKRNWKMVSQLLEDGFPIEMVCIEHEHYPQLNERVKLHLSSDPNSPWKLMYLAVVQRERIALQLMFKIVRERSLKDDGVGKEEMVLLFQRICRLSLAVGDGPTVSLCLQNVPADEKFCESLILFAAANCNIRLNYTIWKYCRDYYKKIESAKGEKKDEKGQGLYYFIPKSVIENAFLMAVDINKSFKVAQFLLKRLQMTEERLSLENPYLFLLATKSILRNGKCDLVQLVWSISNRMDESMEEWERELRFTLLLQSLDSSIDYAVFKEIGSNLGFQMDEAYLIRLLVALISRLKD